MEALRRDSHIAPDINNDFVDGQENYHICTFYECRPMPPLSTLVSRSSLLMIIAHSVANAIALTLSALV